MISGSIEGEAVVWVSVAADLEQWQNWLFILTGDETILKKQIHSNKIKSYINKNIGVIISTLMVLVQLVSISE